MGSCAGTQSQAAEADLVAASSLLEDAWVLAQLGFYSGPVRALQASAAAAASPAWIMGSGALLLGTPVLNGLAALRPVVSGDTGCTAGAPSLDRTLVCKQVASISACQVDGQAALWSIASGNAGC